MTPKVKPLVWTLFDNGSEWSNLTDVGLIYHVTAYGWRYRNGPLNPTSDIELAQAAAQADYAARIIAALDPAWLAGIEAQVKAADGLDALLGRINQTMASAYHNEINESRATYRAAREASHE